MLAANCALVFDLSPVSDPKRNPRRLSPADRVDINIPQKMLDVLFLDSLDATLMAASRDLRDLRNQIYFLTENNDAAFAPQVRQEGKPHPVLQLPRSRLRSFQKNV
jgi:hypothetical protein